MSESGHVDATPSRPRDSRLNYDDVIDLRPIIDTLVKWWREIFLFAAVVAIVAAGTIIITNWGDRPVYVAEATVVLARVTSDVTIDEDFQTQLDGTGGFGDDAMEAHRAALVGLVNNGTVAQAVIDELGDLLEEEEKEPATLLKRVTATSLSPEVDGGNAQSDLIRISAKGYSPEKAAAIANSWAAHYVEHVNTLYGEMPDEVYASIQNELAGAEADYNAAQNDYIDFIATNTIDTLHRRIDEKNGVIGSLQAGKSAIMNDIVGQAMTMRQEIITAYLGAQTQNRLLTFQKEQQANLGLVNQLIDADTESRQMALRMDREARTQLFQQYVQVQINNRLAAMQKDQEARLKLFDQVTNAEIDNRLVALQTDQDARSRLFAQFVETEIANRLLALSEEQQAKTQIFYAYADADTGAKLSVLNEQVRYRIASLADSYSRQFKLKQVLADALALQAQLTQGGEATAGSNGLAILLLKTEAFANSAALSDNIQITLDGIGDLEVNVENQQADLAALVDTLEARVAELQSTIEEQSAMLLDNEDYLLLDEQEPVDDQLSTAIRQKYLALFEVGDLVNASGNMTQTGSLSQAILNRYDELFGMGPLAESAGSAWQGSAISTAILDTYNELFAVGPLATIEDSVWQNSDLSQAILAKYNELFAVGPLASASLVFSNTTPIYQAIEEQYPQLFAIGDLAQLADAISLDTPLDQASAQKAEELLQLKGLEDLPGYSVAAEPMNRAIETLDAEVRDLQAQLATQEAQLGRIQLQRDLALNTFNTLNGKKVEFGLQRTVANREVRLGAAAIPPIRPEPETTGLLWTTAIAGVCGLMLAAVLALFANYQGIEPPLRGLKNSTGVRSEAMS